MVVHLGFNRGAVGLNLINGLGGCDRADEVFTFLLTIAQLRDKRFNRGTAFYCGGKVRDLPIECTQVSLQRRDIHLHVRRLELLEDGINDPRDDRWPKHIGRERRKNRMVNALHRHLKGVGTDGSAALVIGEARIEEPSLFPVLTADH